MTWSDIPFRPTAKALRQFAAAWLIFFLALGAYQYLVRRHLAVGLVLMGLALVIGLLGLVRPAAVRWLFVGWMVVAFPIGWVISLVMLLVMFFGLITPVAVFFRLASSVDFAAADGMPVDLVFGLLSPEQAGASHLQALAAISRLVRDETLYTALAEAEDQEALFALLTNVIDRDAA